MAFPKPCLTCGAPSPQSYCPEHRGNAKRAPRRTGAVARDTSLKRKHGFTLLHQQGKVCALCAAPLSYADLEVDHIIPMLLTGGGGTNELSNLRAVHKRCHSERTAADRRTDAEIRQEAKRLENFYQQFPNARPKPVGEEPPPF